jgi:putative membrane protein
LNAKRVPPIVVRMRFLSTSLTLITAVLHIWFLLLDTVFWTKPIGLAAFAMSRAFAEQTAVFAVHLGLCNGVLAAGLLYGVLRRNDAFTIFCLSWAAAAGILGGVTRGIPPFIIEAVPALVALAALVLTRTSRIRPATAS